MSDKSPNTSTAPGAAAGDAAHSTEIPKIDRPNGASKSGSSAATKAVTRSAAQKPAVAKKASGPEKSGPDSSAPTTPEKTSETTTSEVATAGETDKGRVRPASAPEPSHDRPLTAQDYARTTAESASSTSVIPAVKSDGSDTGTDSAGTDSTGSAKPVEPKAESSTSAVAKQPAVQAGGRAATLRLSYIEPWSVTRMAFAISVAMMIVGVVAVTIFWLVLEVTGIWGQIDGSVTSVLSDDSSSFQITDYLGFGRLVGLSLVLSALNVVIMTVLATIAAHLYNLAAQLLGGFQVTYTSED